MSILQTLIDNNEYPIVFIGSGISKRYIDDFPSWENLLEEYWQMIEGDGNFYSYMNRIARSIKKENPEFHKARLDFETNITVAQYISEKFDSLFLEEKIEVEGLSQKDAYRNEISAFKKSIANRFSNYTLKNSQWVELHSNKN